MSYGHHPALTPEQQKAKRKRAKADLEKEIADFEKNHPCWNDLSKNQKRNMRNKLKKR